MKRLLIVGLMALGLAVTARSAKADCAFEYSCSRHLSYVHTSKNRCFTFSSHSNPLPCAGGGYGGPALWDGLAAYAAPHYAAPAAAPVAAAPTAKTPAFNAPQPKQTPSNSNGVQQTGYFYYGQAANPAYGAGANYGAGYMYYGYGAGYYQAPNYWYDN